MAPTVRSPMKKVPQVFIDFETFSECDLGDCGAFVYSEHPSTDILCLAYQIDDAPIRIYRPYENDDLPYDLFDAIEAAGIINAWNVSFEFSIWTNVCVKRFDWPEIPMICWFDTMAKAAWHGLPLGLDSCCKALNLTEDLAKAGFGKEILDKLSKLQKNGQRIRRNQAPQLFQKLYEYCIQDVRAEKHISCMLSPMKPHEIDFWHIDFLINRRGIPVDVESAIKIRDKVKIELDKANERLPGLTGNLITKASQVQRIVKFAQSCGINIENCQAETLQKVFDFIEANPDKVKEKHKPALEVLDIRKWSGKAAVGKYDRFVDCAAYDDRVHFTMIYHGAHTGRWVGRLIQPHNLFKSTISKKCDVNHFVDAVANRPVECVESVYQRYIHAAASATRSMISAPHGKTFVITDYAAIEARVVFWVSNDQVGLETYRQNRDIYCEMAKVIYRQEINKNDHPHERFVGKQVILGAGYGLGYAGFINTLKVMWNVDIDEATAKAAITSYRNTYSRVAAFWNGVENAFMSAMKFPDKAFKFRDVAFMKPSNEDFLYCCLPSKRLLAFPQPSIRPVKTPWGDIKDALTYKTLDQNKWIRVSTYGGKMTENIVQAVARDLMAHGITELEFMNIPTAFTVHDELILEVDEQNAKQFLETIEKVLTTPPTWAIGLPIDVESGISNRYCKI